MRWEEHSQSFMDDEDGSSSNWQKAVLIIVKNGGNVKKLYIFPLDSYSLLWAFRNRRKLSTVCFGGSMKNDLFRCSYPLENW